MGLEPKIAYKWIREYVEVDVDAAEFARKLSLHGPSIEKWKFDEQLDDNILEIEVTTNRVDMACVLGIAREASVVFEKDFLWARPKVDLFATKIVPLKVKVHNFKKCPRYQAIVIDGVSIKDSPEWMQKRLMAAGINPINNIVDITNYVLLEYGQPMHAFDYTNIVGNEINIRAATEGELLQTLSAEEDIKLTANDLVIADTKSPIALAGVKGGEKSGINPNTTTIVLESANFEPTSTRKSARRYNLYTEASSLFEKGLPRESTYNAMLRAIELVLNLAGGEIASDLIDENNGFEPPIVINYPYNLTKRILGLDITNEEVLSILDKLGFTCIDKGDYAEVEVPYLRRSDVQLDYDLTEEIARIYGYHKIQSIIPASEIPQVSTPVIIKHEDRVRDMLVDNGFTEAFTYSLVSEKHLQIADEIEENTIKISNPLTMDYVYMRTEMSSGMLMVSKQNETYKDNLKFFEVSNIYLKTSDTGLPKEQSTLSILINGTNYKQLFYELKGIWELVLELFGIDLNLITYSQTNIKEPFSTSRSAQIYFKDQLIGLIGLASKDAIKQLGLKKENAILEVNFEVLSEIISNTTKGYNGIPKYPAVKRDLAFVLDSKVKWQDIKDLVISEGGNLLKEVELFDMFEDKKLGESKKSIAFHISLQSEEKTLEELEVSSAVDKITNKIVSTFGAVVRE